MLLARPQRVLLRELAARERLERKLASLGFGLVGELLLAVKLSAWPTWSQPGTILAGLDETGRMLLLLLLIQLAFSCIGSVPFFAQAARCEQLAARSRLQPAYWSAGQLVRREPTQWPA